MGVDAGFCMYDVVVKKFTFAVSSPDEFLFLYQRKVSRRRPEGRRAGCTVNDDDVVQHQNVNVGETINFAL